MKKCLLLLWICLLTFGLFAQSGTKNSTQNTSSERSTHVTAAQALEVGYTFMRTGSLERGGGIVNGNVSRQTMQLIYTGATIDGSECFYVFSLQPRGFVIVAADERAEPILGYSYDNPFMVEGMPDNVRNWLGYYGEQIKAVVDNDILPSAEITERWTLLKSGQAMPNRSVTAVSPLIQTTWNQDNYYNLLCPADASGPGGHAYAGCVATALAQIIRYWQWPNQGFNSHSYDHSTYGTLSVDFNSATYNYNNMPNSLSSSSSSTQKNAVAKLIYHCGVAVDMDYSPNSSSAYFFPVPSVLYNYFAFTNNGTYVYKSDYSNSDWTNLIKQELNNARPVFYSGQGTGGHAFICDGYDNSGNFHFNWGWGGYNDGYFALDALTPSPYTFSQDQEAIIGVSATGAFIRCSTSQMVISAPNGEESDAQTLSVRGHSLSGNITVTVGNGFKVSTNGTNYSTSATLSSSGGTLYVKYVPTSSGNTEYTMTLTSGSCSASVTLYGSSSSDPCIAPKNLTGTHNGTTVNLSWNEPVTYSSGSPASTEISWETSSNISTYYGYGAVSHCMVQRFEPSDLTPYNQYLLKAVSFIGSPYATSFSVVVFKGGSYSNGVFNPGEQVVNQIVPMSTVNTTGWNTVTLSNPVLVDATSELWFGVVATGDYVIPYVEGNVVSNKGNILGLMFNGNTDFYWYNGYEVNIPLKGTLEKISSQVLRYDVYRQSTLIGNTTNTTYTDNNPLNSSCTYTISAVWNNNCSESATVTVSAPAAIPPTVTTNTVSNISSSAATCCGNVTSNGGATVTARGICYSTSPNPTVSDNHTSNGGGTGSFSSRITGLMPNTTYYVRAYATNSAGTAYGENISFTTTYCESIALPYSETFENYTTSTTASTGVQPDCWNLVREEVAMTDANRPQLYYKSSFAHSGKYSLKMGYRCIYAMPALSDDVPVKQVKLEMYLRQANAAYQLEVGVWDDVTETFVPVKRFNNNTTGVEYVECDFKSYNGNGRRIAFRNVLGGGANYNYSYNYLDDIVLTDICESISLPYSETFESYTTSTTASTGILPDCWDLVREEVAMTDANRPQLYYKSSFAHSGNYSLKMGYRCICAMPALSDNIPVNRVKLEMYLRQANAAYQLEVGVWDDVTETFVPVKRFNNSTTSVEYVECDFSEYTGNGRRIAFRNVLGGGANYNYSYNYLDDIVLTDICEPISLPYYETFESYTTSTTASTGVEPDCWDLVREEVAMTDANRPQLYYKSSFAHSGNYSLKMGYRGIYAMPALPENVPVNQVSLDMYLRQANAAYRLEVGVWDDQTQTFDKVQLFNNSTTGVEHVTCDFSNYNGNGRRIAFRNVLGGGANYNYSYNYLDDITITRITNKSAEVTTANTANTDMMDGDRDMVDILVYPNPTRDYINVQCTMNNVQCSGIEVIDVYGKVVRTVVETMCTSSLQTRINVSGLASGMYFVRVTTDKGAVTKPFVVR